MGGGIWGEGGARRRGGTLLMGLGLAVVAVCLGAGWAAAVPASGSASPPPLEPPGNGTGVEPTDPDRSPPYQNAAAAVAAALLGVAVAGHILVLRSSVATESAPSVVRDAATAQPGPGHIASTARTRSGAGGLTAELRESCVWSDEMVGGARLALVDVPFVTVGGGLGSFSMVSFLRVAGVGRDDIAVLTPLDRPYETFKSRAEASQLGDGDLLRSDSSSRIDNIWGFPGFAIEEAMQRRSLRPVARVVAEPVLREYFNPRCAQLYDGIDREAARIGWSDMVVKGRVDMVRHRDGGGYFVLLAPAHEGAPAPPVVFRCRYVHLAVGYPSLRFLPNLQEYRARHQDRRMVHVYEPHDHVYETLRRRPGVVLLRGAGIAASRILERLIDDRELHGAQTEIIHLFRNYPVGPTGPVWCRRPGGDGFVYQAFNFPKSAFGGQVARKAARLDPQERADYIMSIGGSTTPKRRRWQEQLGRARRDGWYRVQVGEVEDVALSEEGRIAVTVRPRQSHTRRLLETDFVLDATGLNGDAAAHGVIRDLLECGHAQLNPLGRLDVDEHFEVLGARSGAGRIYASGAVTLGGPVAPVDSFFGLNQAALKVCDDLARQGFCARIGPLGSVRAWLDWVRNRPV